MVKFNEESHTYTLEDGEKCTSVTTLVHSLFPVFDADKVIDGIEKSSSSKYKGLSREEIKRQWKLNGKRAATAGTSLHKYIEDFYLGKPGLVRRNDPEAQQFHKFQEAYTDLQPFQVEWVVCDPKFRVAGTVDMVFRDSEGKYHIYDWKRAANIVRNRRYEDYCLHPELGYIPNTNFWHYSLQLNLYKRIIERTESIRISSMKLVQFHPDLNHYRVVEVESMQDEVETILASRQV